MIEELFNQFDWRVTLETAPFPDGRIKKSVRVYRCDSVHILAFTKPDTILLIKEFRPFYQENIFAIPGGKADKENDVLVAAQRELREESGYRAEKLEPYGTMNLSDSIAITNHIFIAHDLVKDPLPLDEEMISVFECTIPDAIEKVLSSPRVHAPSAFALLKYAREHGL